MRQLLYLPGVESDLENGATWYEDKQTGLGKRFLTEFDLVCHRLPFYPEMYQTVYVHVRRTLMHDFKYAIYYRIKPNAIEIIVALSCRKNPDAVASRLSEIPH